MKSVLFITEYTQTAGPLSQVLRKRGYTANIVPPERIAVEKALAEQYDNVHEIIIFLDCDSAANPIVHKAWLDHLRNQLYRCPVIVLCQPGLVPRIDQPGLCFITKPPKLKTLDIALDEARPCSADTLYERAIRLLVAIASELKALQRNLAGTLTQEEQLDLMGRLQHAIDQVYNNASLYQDLTIKEWPKASQILLDALKSSQAVPIETVRNFTSIVAKVEEVVRRLPQPDTKLAGELHTLNGVVRRLAWAQGWSDRVGALLELLKLIVQRGAPYHGLLAEVGADKLLSSFYVGLVTVQANNIETTAVRNLRSLCESHQDSINSLSEWAASREPVSIAGDEITAYQRVIIVEDDEGWREKMILPLLQKEFPELELLTARDYTEARRLIQGSDQPSIVLVDLGLPPAIGEYLGLKLLEEFVTLRRQDRYIVLTAAEDYEDVNRQALLAGVSPHDYILKDPDNWEAEVTTRIYTALQPRSRIHKIEVCQCTARLICIDGVEIELERKPFRLFDFMANNWRRKWSAEEIVDFVTSYPYYEDLEGGTTQDIANYILKIRRAIANAFRAIQRPIDPCEVINTDVYSDPERARYYLTSRPTIYETFEDIPHRPPRLPILVVEDDPQYAQAIVEALTTKRLPCESAGSVTEAKQKIDVLTPQIITLDLQLPSVSGATAEEPLGLEVLAYLQQRVPEARVAVLTNIEWGDSVRLSILRTGIYLQDFLSKAWDHAIDRLVRSVWRLVSELKRGLTFISTEGPTIIHYVRLGDSQTGLAWIDNIHVKLPPSHYELLRILAKARNVPVDRELLISELWPDSDNRPDNIDKALNTKMNQLKRAIRQQTKNQIDPDHLIRSYDGAYWLQAVVSLSPSEE